MDYEMEVEVFRAGDYGSRGTYSEADLDRMAQDYAPSAHEAPVTVDHRQDGPALGWVRALRCAGRVLVARLGSLDAEFRKQLEAGALKKRSVELYRSGEVTGLPYLKAVTFLGAGAPIVKGLADPVFAESEGLVRIDFEEDPLDEAAETNVETFADEAEEAEAVASVDSSNVDEQQESPSEPEAQFADLTVTEDAVAFCESLREEGRLLPAWEEKGMSRFLSALDDTTPLAFGESDDAPRMTVRAWFRDFLRSMVPMVPMGEAVPAGPVVAPGCAPFPENWRGARLDRGSLALHDRVRAFQDAHPGTAYAEALCSVAATV